MLCISAHVKIEHAYLSNNSIFILIDRPKSVSQLLCNRILQCFKIFKLNINSICMASFLVT